MKKLILITFLALVSIGRCQFLIFLDKGDEFRSPETDMVVMDKYSFAKFNYVSEKYDTLKKEVLRYDSLLSVRDSEASRVQMDYEKLINNREREIAALSEGYSSMKSNLQQSIDQQNRLQVDYLKLEKRNRRIKRWRNFFMGTSAVLGGVIYLLIRF